MAEAIAKRWFAHKCKCAVPLLKEHGWDIRSGGLTDEVIVCSLRTRDAVLWARHEALSARRSQCTSLISCSSLRQRAGFHQETDSLTTRLSYEEI